MRNIVSRLFPGYGLVHSFLRDIKNTLHRMDIISSFISGVYRIIIISCFKLTTACKFINQDAFVKYGYLPVFRCLQTGNFIVLKQCNACKTFWIMVFFLLQNEWTNSISNQEDIKKAKICYAFIILVETDFCIPQNGHFCISTTANS